METNKFTGALSLEPSINFNVILASIGSAARIDEVLDGSYRRTWTLEDFFTLSHQNLLVTLNYLLSNIINVDELFVVPQIKKIQDIFKQPLVYHFSPEEIVPLVNQEGIDSSTLSFNASFVGLFFTEKGVSFNYNIPMRGHSSGFILEYDYAKGTMRLHANFYRNLERPTIFKHIALYAGMSDIYTDTKLLHTEIEQNRVHLVWDVGVADSIKLRSVITRMLILMYPESGNIQIPSDHWALIYPLKNELHDENARNIVLNALDYYAIYYQESLRGEKFKPTYPRYFDSLLDEVMHSYVFDTKYHFKKRINDKTIPFFKYRAIGWDWLRNVLLRDFNEGIQTLSLILSNEFINEIISFNDIYPH